MKNTMIKLVSLSVACAVISACDSDFSNPVGSQNFSSGDADFSNFVSVGDSLTAGYADGALYLDGQKNSYPAILAQQFSKVGGGAFNQPLVDDNLGGLLFGGNENPKFGNRLVLNANPDPDVDDERPTPEPIVGTPTTEVFSLLTGSFNNMGVPGAKSFHLTVNAYGDPAGLMTDPATSNPYYVRFAPSATTSVIVAAAGQAPSFFVMWIGNNDVLSYATNGGAGLVGVGNPPYSADGNDITDPAVFAGVYPQLVGAMMSNPAAKGVLVNIPDVATIPYFTTVTYNPVEFKDIEKDLASIAALNSAYAPYNGGVTASIGFNGLTEEEAAQRQITFALGQNAVVIFDDDLTDLSGVPGTDGALKKMRQATAADLLVLTSGSIIGTEFIPGDPRTIWGLGKPLDDIHVLIPSEIQAIETARLAFNVTIKEAADDNANLIFVDAAALMAGIQASGYDYGTGTVTSLYASGGAFSLDGVHPTARGYSIISNEIIKAINTGFNANVPMVDPGAYSTIFVK